MLPQDPYILLSLVNTKLRDYYDSIEGLCDDLEIDQDDLMSQLNAIGYFYHKDNRQFLAK